MRLCTLPYNLTICRVPSLSDVDTDADFFCFTKTDEELSLVCLTEDTPSTATAREDGWKAMRIQGVLDFSLIGILSEISTLLAAASVGIFVVSTYNTDYVLVKAADYERAVCALVNAGHTVE